ncbi:MULTISPECIES: hypothetical protein [Limnospira]|uniref:hypothetical protein n=1 Tax=Limnospira TaxID=2596745 RepID=UPI00138DE5E6|nr:MULTISPECIES: hypothetical protein [Limnospira]QJB24372.1 hypothetical protein HFV01_06320 [Limnospira fusiformis SAG 85.79]MDT9191101.1 hypothetical protein [Limnospira sp. PMC 894.15]MDT9211552.1 hypothetical protein [Limnospira sp. PMC 1252.20]MDT9252352.1 hypothetical protein [Limnospira sp. PMC 1280.21]MDT9267524.1 hypothetical protein [Limnospira sp. PMC 1223.20]
MWDRNANGSHETGDTVTFSGDTGLAAFMGKGAPSNVTEDVNSRSFTLNGVDLRLPTVGIPIVDNHFQFADANNQVYIPGVTTAEEDAGGSWLVFRSKHAHRQRQQPFARRYQ